MLYFSLSVLYTVYFVVRCCDLYGVLYLFILFQLCTISNEKKCSRKQSQPKSSGLLFQFLLKAIHKTCCLVFIERSIVIFIIVGENLFWNWLYMPFVCNIQHFLDPKKGNLRSSTPLNQKWGLLETKLLLINSSVYAFSFASKKMISKLILRLHQSLISLI